MTAVIGGGSSSFHGQNWKPPEATQAATVFDAAPVLFMWFFYLQDTKLYT